MVNRSRADIFVIDADVDGIFGTVIDMAVFIDDSGASDPTAGCGGGLNFASECVHGNNGRAGVGRIAGHQHETGVNAVVVPNDGGVV